MNIFQRIPMEANDRLSHLGKNLMAACIACTNAQDGCLQAMYYCPRGYHSTCLACPHFCEDVELFGFALCME